jgi:uncharacterized RDD family membrane protein YckC
MTTPSDPAPQPPPQPPPAPNIVWEPPKEEAGPAPGVKFASHGVRLVAYIIDSLIVGLIYLVVFAIIFAVLIGGARASDFRDGQLSPASAAAIGFATVIFLVTFLLTSAYFPFFWARSGQTPGMRPFGLYVVRDNDGGKISVGQAILRLIGMWVSAFAIYIGFIWIFIDPRRRGWHDLIGGTVVIERTSRG